MYIYNPQCALEARNIDNINIETVDTTNAL